MLRFDTSEQHFRRRGVATTQLAGHQQGYEYSIIMLTRMSE